MFRIVAHYKGFSLNPGGTAIHMNTTVKFNIYSRERFTQATKMETLPIC
jgi:hypothetical protein